MLKMSHGSLVNLTLSFQTGGKEGQIDVLASLNLMGIGNEHTEIEIDSKLLCEENDHDITLDGNVIYYHSANNISSEIVVTVYFG